MFYFGNRSNRSLNGCTNDLQVIAREAIKRTPFFDWGIHVGHRSVEEQQRLYAQGRETEGPIVTHIDGINRKSKHNHYPSKAFDFHIYVPGRPDLTWNEHAIIFIAGIIMSTAEDLRNRGVIRSKLRWGGNFDRDNVIGSAEGEFFDPVHIEIDD